MGKETKTNAMRILDRMKIPYTLNQYNCEEFIDGVHVADMLGQSYDESFKTIVTVGKSQGYYVFALPIDKEIDLKNPKTNHKNAGFTDEERGKMTALLGSGFTDTFRYFYPDATGVYSWWSYMFHAREKNAGWRIDYFITSDRLQPKLRDAKIHTDIFGSDHCPIELDIDL